MFKSNCHTHTNYCDGKNSALEMATAAIEKGFTSLGFSGHSPMREKSSWTMSAESVKAYFSEINALKQQLRDKIDILCGIELDADYADVNPSDFDYVIGSLHQLEKDGKFYDVDYTPEMLKEAVDVIFDGSYIEMSRFYYNALADFVIRERVDVVGHIDLITKFNLDTPLFDENNEEYQKIVLAAVDRILSAKSGIYFEVNTGAMYRKGKKTPYPADFILRHLCEQGGKITLTSDAHCCEALDFGFDRALDICRACGFKEVFYITSEGWKSIKI